MAKVKKDEGAIPRYSPNVLQGNWFEELNEKKENLMEFINSMKRGELMHQYAGNFFSKHEQPVTISPDKTNVTFGDRVTIINPLVKSKQPKDEEKQYTGVSVSVVYLLDDYLRSPDVFPGMFCGCSGDILPNIRNTFCIESVDGKKNNGGELTYGEDFALSILHSYANKKLYLESLPQHFSAPIGQSQKVRVSLVPDYSVYCRWKIFHVDPVVRKISKNHTVPANANVIIAHSSTNQSLCALDCWLPTIFGQESELTIETRENRFHRPLISNVWQIRNDKQTGTWQDYLEQIENRNKKKDN